MDRIDILLIVGIVVITLNIFFMYKTYELFKVLDEKVVKIEYIYE